MTWSIPLCTIKMDKSPAFILSQFGLTPDDVEQMVVKTGDNSFDFTRWTRPMPVLRAFCMTATVASVVDKLVQNLE